MSLPPPGAPRRREVTVPPRKPPAQLLSLRAIVAEDETPEASYLDQDGFEERLTEYRKRVFHFVGVRIEAEIKICETTQILKSPGLWGIESDIEPDELLRVVSEEWEVLRTVLKTVGVPTSEMPKDADPEWVEWRT